MLEQTRLGSEISRNLKNNSKNLENVINYSSKDMT